MIDVRRKYWEPMRIGAACLWVSMIVVALLPIWAGALPLGVLAIVAATGAGVALYSAAAEDLVFLTDVAWFPAVALAGFTGFALLQTVPAGPLSHSIWQSVSPALGRTVWGSITVDVGMTFLGTLAGGTLLALFVLAAMVGMSRDRMKAELYLLVAASCAVAALSLAAPFMGVTDGAVASACAAMPLCLLISTAGIAAQAEVRLSQWSRDRRDSRWPSQPVALSLSTVGLGLVLGVGATAGADFVVASAVGLVVAGAPFLALGTRTGAWGLGGIVLTAAVVGLAFAGHLGLVVGPSGAVRDSARALDVAASMLQDAPLLGTGLGTFERMAQLYRLPGDALARPSGLVRLGVEIGLPVLLALLLSCLVAIGFLLRGALRRGRGRVYPALGAGAGAATLVQMASSEMAPGFPSALLLALTAGLAFAQSKSRSKAF